MKYDYIIVGAGLYGAVFAYEAKKAGKRCLVIDKRDHIAGNIYCEEIEGINVHKYGAHIFHTSNKRIWDYINQFAEFNNYINSPIAIYKYELYNLPFNMNTFSKMWNIHTPQEAKDKIAEQVAKTGINEPKNLEEQGLSLVGKDVFEKLVKGYTEKQWDTLKNNGEGIVKIFRLLLSNVFRFVLLMIIITSMIVSREFRLEDILRLYKKC